jgi:hypothetical protein
VNNYCVMLLRVAATRRNAGCCCESLLQHAAPLNCVPALRRAAVRATYTWLGGDTWDIQYVSRARLFLGVPLWRRQLSQTSPSVDFDHAVRPTYVDGELCVLRAPAVCAGGCELRAERVYVLRRMKNRLWQGDGSFSGLSDKPVFGFELDP